MCTGQCVPASKPFCILTGQAYPNAHSVARFRVKPGDRVQIVGTYRALPNKSNGTTSGVFRCGTGCGAPNMRGRFSSYYVNPLIVMVAL